MHKTGLCVTTRAKELSKDPLISFFPAMLNDFEQDCLLSVVHVALPTHQISKAELHFLRNLAPLLLGGRDTPSSH